MKTLFLTILAFGFMSNMYSQKAMSMNDARAGEINMKLMDSTYMSGMHIDSTKAAFPDKQDEYSKAYDSLRMELANYLNKNNFNFGKTIKCVNKVYFKKDGTIEYFIYGFRDLDPEKEAEFKKLLNEFIQNYRFPMNCGKEFRQCGPTTYIDKNDKRNLEK